MKDIEKIHPGITEAVRKMNESLKIMNAHFKPMIEAMEANLNYARKMIQPSLDIANAFVNELTEKQPHRKKYEDKIARLMADQGWYIDGSMNNTLMGDYVDFTEDGKLKDANNLMMDYFNSRKKTIVQELYERHPSRKTIILKAFKAHVNGDYEICILAYFTQTDGICHDKFKINFFAKKNDKPALSEELYELAQDIWLGSIYYALVNNTPITMSKFMRQKGWDKLNRHQIMHGEITDYGTEVNSLRALSLLNYVSWVLDFDDVKD